MENIIKEIDKLEAECTSQWKNESSIIGAVDFARVLRDRIKNCSIPPVSKCCEEDFCTNEVQGNSKVCNMCRGYKT